MKIKTLIMICGLAALALAVPRVGATEFKGTTAGSGAPNGFSGTANSNTLGGLVYTNGSFDSFGAGSPEQAFIGASSITDSLGQFALDNSAFVYSGHTFTMSVTFNLPTGSGTQAFTASLSGTVTVAAGGGVLIHWTTGTQTYTGSSGIVFTLTANDLSLNHGKSGFVSGTINVLTPAVPDGGSAVALLGIALAGIEGARRMIRARKA
jgi:hypothetical protein